MSLELEDNYQFSYQALLLFLSRPGEKGYVFCRADDYRFAPKITDDLVRDLEFKGIHTAVIYLQKDTDEPIMHQLETAAVNASALIIANLYDIVDKTEMGLANLMQLNFGRETLWRLNIPIVFWADAQSMNTIANHAPDLYSQRRHTTVHFTGMADDHVVKRLQKDGWETFLSSQHFQDLETNIQILEKRLRGAEETRYPAKRIVTEIALPLAKSYAQISLIPEARELLVKYEPELKSLHNVNDLRALADIYYAMHDYDSAIQILSSANAQIETTYSDINYPEHWFINLIKIAQWLEEVGQLETILPTLKKASSLLEKYKEIEWKDRALMIILNILGDFSLSSSNLKEAKRYYQQALGLAEQLSENNLYLDELRRDLGVSFNKLGDVSIELGNLSEAKKYYDKALKLTQQLSSNNPHSEQLKRDLSVSFNRLGDTSRALGDLKEAKQYYERALNLAEELSRNNPYSELLLRDIAVFYIRLAILTEQNDLANALQYYQDSLIILQRLSTTNPYSQQLKDDISWVQEKSKDISSLINQSSYTNRQ